MIRGTVGSHERKEEAEGHRSPLAACSAEGNTSIPGPTSAAMLQASTSPMAAILEFFRRCLIKASETTDIPAQTPADVHSDSFIAKHRSQLVPTCKGAQHPKPFSLPVCTRVAL